MIEGREIIDISPVISPETAVFPGDVAFKRKELMSFDLGDHLTLSSIESTVHIGAHADAPNHYHPEGSDIAQRDLSFYIGPVEVIEVNIRPSQRITMNDFDRKFPDVPRVLFKTNSMKDPNVWTDTFNSLSPEVITSLSSSGVKLVGIDTPSIDPHDSKDLESHTTVYEHNLAVLEGVVLGKVSPGKYDLIALPLPIKGADASPVRAILLK